LSGSTSKRVVLYRYERQPLDGIVSPGVYLQETGVELMSLDGNVVIFPYPAIKALCFVHEFGGPQLFSQHSLFDRRPRVPGLWTRFTFLDDDRLDGILPHNLLEWPSQGYIITPPHATGMRQRVFIPRASVKATELRGVVGVSLTGSAQAGVGRRARRGGTLPEGQLEMFTD
jgi:hypothetical protein